ncbi:MULTISPECIES: hypothetical protein [unclassified Mesorhizobium]|uniref:hypothetical protein n=1 Tax=unclassified Mesorhizobium TaxID=325217 RepID=UPI001FE238FD|nr:MULTISPECIES: hypothetical protein [unclassified Mesorhizobium]
MKASSYQLCKKFQHLKSLATLNTAGFVACQRYCTKYHGVKFLAGARCQPNCSVIGAAASFALRVSDQKPGHSIGVRMLAGNTSHLCTGRNSCVLKQRRSSLIVAGVFRGDFDMPFLLAILGVLGAAAFWWYRMKAMNEAAREVADVVGRVQGNIRRKKLRKQAALSPLTAIDNPVVAAATLITAIVSEQGPILPQREAVIREVISGISDGQKKTDEAVVYAKWAAAQIDDTTIVIDKLAPFLRERLDPHEREDLLQMLNRVAKGGEQSLKIPDQRILRLRQKLGFEVN